VSDSRRGFLDSLPYLVGGGLLLAAFLFIGLTEYRGLGIALGVVAVVVARFLYAMTPVEPAEDETDLD
jgi:hypothetical protein